MNTDQYRHLYGPVPSRRLGRSLGIDLVPFKSCTYDCIYCQLGRTTHKSLERKPHVAVETILAELERKLAETDLPDYISLAGSGEPTLNAGIGELVAGIARMTKVPVAVLTNGSLLWRRDVQDELLEADLVLPSLDAGDERLFRYVNRPHPDLGFKQVIDGVADFTRRYTGEVWLEVLLLAGVTGLPAEVEKIAAVAGRIKPARVQLNTASRPPAEEFAFPLIPARLRGFRAAFVGKVDIIGDIGPAAATARAITPIKDVDVMGLLSRRPCTASDVATGLGIHMNEALKILDALLAAAVITTVIVGGRTYHTVAAAPGKGAGA